MSAYHRTFGGFGIMQDQARNDAAAFATTIGREHVVSITESYSESVFRVTVWFWGPPVPPVDD